MTDPDDDDIDVMWEVRRETTSKAVGGDKEYLPSAVDGLILASAGTSVTLKAPVQTGAYRLFAYVYDGQGNAAHANFPFYVN